MATNLAAPAQWIDVHPLGEKLAWSRTTTLIKTRQLEVIRLVLPAGKEIADHQAPGDITVQCLEGAVSFTALGNAHTLTAGQLLYLPAGEGHALRALDDSSLLLTICLRPRDPDHGSHP